VANIITNEKSGAAQYLMASDGDLSSMVSVLLLGGSDLAKSAWERELMTWLAEHDQAVLGRGLAGFDLDEIAWDPERYTDQQGYLLRVIDRARAGHRWDVLGPARPDDPASRPVIQKLEQLRGMVSSYRAEYIEPPKRWTWQTTPDRIEKCPVHDVFSHGQGCQICNRPTQAGE
jgi:hypothetical protein